MDNDSKLLTETYLRMNETADWEKASDNDVCDCGHILASHQQYGKHFCTLDCPCKEFKLKKKSKVEEDTLKESSKKDLVALAKAFLKSSYVKRGLVDLNDKDSIWESLNEFADEYGMADASSGEINWATRYIKNGQRL